MIRSIIVDDEKTAIEGLSGLIELFAPAVKVVGSAQTIDEAITLIMNSQFDVLFLDISIGRQTGFDLLLEVENKKSFKTIFVTAHDDHAIKALRKGAVDYLTKPIDPDELVAAIDRLKQQLGSSKSKEETNPVLALPGVSETVFINASDIEYIKADGNYSHIYMVDAKHHVVSKKLSVFEDRLGPQRIIRVHKSFMINLDHVKGYHKSAGGEITMNSEVNIPVGKTRRAETFEALKDRATSV